MNDPAMKDILELEMMNFGPIVEAKIDLRPLTVFIGPSNTGKSYLAILIYALHRYFSGGGWLERRRFSPNPPMFRSEGSKKWSKKTINEFTDLAGQMVADTGRSRFEEGIVLPGSVVDVIRSRFGEQGDYLGNEIGRCFGIKEPGALIRKGIKGAAHIVLRKHNPDDLAPIDHRLAISANASKFNTIIPDGTQMRLGIGNDDHPIAYLRHMAMEMISRGGLDERPPNFSAWRLLEALANHVRPQIVGPLGMPAFYLPADRTGVMHAHSVVVSALIASAAMTGLRPAAPMPMVSGVLADFLEQLIELDRSPHGRRKARHDLDMQIEKAILGGSIGVDRSEAIGYPHYTYKPDGWKESLSLMHASSMVSELAPVVLYLRHMVRTGNVLIVEEPESHLHPAMQVEFTRQLAGLVKKGIRVIVTTHSEWVLEELANIVRRSKFSTSDRQKTASAQIALHPDEVGAWLFKHKKRPRGSVVEEVKMDDETGLYPTDFDAVSEELYNESVNIFGRAQREEAK